MPSDFLHFTLCFRSSTDKSAALRTRRLRVQILPETPVFPPVVQQQRQPPQKRSGAGANPAWGTLSKAPEAQQKRAPPCEGGGRRCESCRERHFQEREPDKRMGVVC